MLCPILPEVETQLEFVFEAFALLAERSSLLLINGRANCEAHDRDRSLRRTDCSDLWPDIDRLPTESEPKFLKWRQKLAPVLPRELPIGSDRGYPLQKFAYRLPFRKG